ncbi:MAG: tetratricopeptide repeat protein [Moheibacter sp.]
MKTPILILLFLTSFTVQAQQEEYTAFLEQAWESIGKKDEKGFNSNLKYFSVAVNRDKITPEILSKENLNLYTRCLYSALTNQFKLSNDLAQQAVLFLQYDIENYPDNYFSLGYLYDKGYGVSQDFDKAIYWYEKAINFRNSATAMNNIGNIYYMQKNYSQAKYWFEKATLKGNGPGMHGLAYLYEYGYGVNQDINKAVELYVNASNAGHVDAMFNLGLMYLNGKKVTANPTESRKWFKKAAEAGDVEAMVYLGQSFLNGDSVMQNQDEARFWFNKSCQAGYQKGCDNLNSLK